MNKKSLIEKYFAMWLTGDGSHLSEFFTQDVVYTESCGTGYRGLEEMMRWFADWNTKGRVLEWRILRMLAFGETAVCEWYFRCRYEGEIGEFTGASVMDFRERKIADLREYQSKLPVCDPYGEGDGTDFRMARMNDLPAVLALYAGAVRNMRKHGVEQWDEIYPDRGILEKDIAAGEMLLLAEREKILSAVVLNGEQAEEYGSVPWLFTKEAPVAVIHRLCVDAGQQGNGVGGKTLRLCEEYLRAKGIRCIRLDAFPQNPAAIRLYETEGYRRAGQVFFRKGLFYCYEKVL